MEMTIHVPDKVVERAAALGMPVREFVSHALEEMVEDSVPAGFVRLGPTPLDPSKATSMIREIASRNTLGGLSVKSLIEEGRV